MIVTTAKNRISDIRCGRNLDANLAYARERLFKEGSVDISVLEILSYLKMFQPDFFAEHENDIIEMMGLYFKKPKANSFISLIFADYGQYVKEEFGEEFTPVQADILKKIRKMDTFSFSAPTSTGKSFVFRNLIKNASADVAIIVPSRALINEYYDRVREIIQDKTVNVLTFVDKINTKHAKRNIFVLTPERARELFKLKSELSIELVLFDEAQLSDEDSVRGLYFDSIVRRVQKAFPNAKCIFAHPFIENPEAQLKRNNVDVSETASASRYAQKNVGQIFYVHQSGNFYHFGIDKEIMGARKIQASFDPIEKVISEGGSVLIYVPKAQILDGRVYIEFKKYLDMCTPIENAEAKKLIENLKDYIGASNDKNDDYISDVLEKMKRGIVIHHGSMPLTARLILEHYTQKRFCRICFATSTLEQGINMPFDLVYLNTFEESKPLSVKNLIGRAGRSTSDNAFDVGVAVVKNSNMGALRKVIAHPEIMDEVSHLDNDDEKLDEKYQEFKEAIKNDEFNDEYNLTNKDVQKLSSDDINYIISTLLDMIFDGETLVVPQWGDEGRNDRRNMYNDFISLYHHYLGRSDDEGLTPAEENVLKQAIKIMLWRVHGKTFKLICQYRYDYATRKRERKEMEKSGRREILNANYLKGYADIPDKNLNNHPLFATNESISKVSYDSIIYDTYDYLDKLIGFKLSDIYYAIFHQYWKATDDNRAQQLAKYIRYGTDSEREIWMLRYGLTFEDIDWATPCIDLIDEQEIVFNENYEALTEEQKKVLEYYYHK